MEHSHGSTAIAGTTCYTGHEFPARVPREHVRRQRHDQPRQPRLDPRARLVAPGDRGARLRRLGRPLVPARRHAGRARRLALHRRLLQQDHRPRRGPARPPRTRPAPRPDLAGRLRGRRRETRPARSLARPPRGRREGADRRVRSPEPGRPDAGRRRALRPHRGRRPSHRCATRSRGSRRRPGPMPSGPCTASGPVGPRRSATPRRPATASSASTRCASSPRRRRGTRSDRSAVLHALDDAAPMVRRAAVDALGTTSPGRRPRRPARALAPTPETDVHLRHAVKLALLEIIRVPGTLARWAAGKPLEAGRRPDGGCRAGAAEPGGGGVPDRLPRPLPVERPS